MKIPTSIAAFTGAILACALLIRTADAIVIASDNASDPAYADNWIIGDNGGTGFGPWSNIGPYGADPIMEIDTGPTAEPDNDLGTPAFRINTGGIFGGGGGYIIDRPFNVPMQPGQTFKIDYDGYSISPEGQPGRQTFIRLDSAGGERLALYSYYYNNGGTAFGSDFWGITAETANDNLAGGASLPADSITRWRTPYSTTDGSDGFTLIVDVVTIDTYRLRVIDDGITKLDISGLMRNGAAVTGQGLNKLSLYGSETSGGAEPPGSVAYFNNLLIETTAAVGLPGDFNGNHSVDAADYVTWRENLGMPTETALNGSGDGVNGVDNGDFLLWKSNFGKSSQASGSALQSTSVPEPSTLVLLAVAMVAWMSARKKPR